MRWQVAADGVHSFHLANTHICPTQRSTKGQTRDSLSKGSSLSSSIQPSPTAATLRGSGNVDAADVDGWLYVHVVEGRHQINQQDRPGRPAMHARPAPVLRQVRKMRQQDRIAIAASS